MNPAATTINIKTTCYLSVTYLEAHNVVPAVLIGGDMTQKGYYDIMLLSLSLADG